MALKSAEVFAGAKITYEDEAFCCSFSSYCIGTIFHRTAFRAMEHHLLQQNSRQHRRIIRKQERKNRTGLSDSHTWRLEQVGLHPARVQISPMAIGWFEDEIDLFVETRPRAGGKQPPLPKARRPE